jgi:hypothetical protein
LIDQFSSIEGIVMSHDPMNHEEAAKNQMVERFALGELRGSDRERFEAHFFDCQECFDEVQVTSEFLRHARSVLSREPEKSWLSRMTADLWRPAPALVSVLLLFVVGAAVYQNLQIAAFKKPKAATNYFLGKQTRAPQAEKPIIAHSGAPISLSVVFTPESEFKSYRALLTGDSGKVRYSIPLDPQEDDDLAYVILPPGSLKEGKYNLVILGNPSSGPFKDIGGGSFYLRLVD